MKTSQLRSSLRRVAIGAYVLWLVAVVLHMVGRYSSFPMLEPARTGMVVGAALLTLYGAVRIVRSGIERAKARL
ncbi:hypothetical protein [Natronomonas marina]|jgi:hypothetical protein|uniref:hypothetical protein n=1 Tax=Natronomonas marina TaxID=2961939 RepID=UPI0020C9CC00|nr:hypothetical protein [Natronomonas marina]